MITGIASLTGAINLIVTALNMRTKGMSLMRMPVFTWMILVIQFLLLFAIPVITVALFLLMFQRQFDATFFTVAAGADPLLWQHLFWIFGHPEVYILVLPSFGIVSEVLPVFSKKPLFGYPFVVFSGAAIGFVGWGVWAHHMFASGPRPGQRRRVLRGDDGDRHPDRRQDRQLDAHDVGRQAALHDGDAVRHRPRRRVHDRRAVGVTHAVAPSDTQQTDTYYIVAHFHYVLFGGAVLGFFAGFYYWWPKVFGKCRQREARQVELLADDHRHEPDVRADAHHRPAGPAAADVRVDRGACRRGLLQPRVLEPASRRSARSSSPSACCCSSINVVHTHRKAPPAPLDPWDARTLEWMTTNPPKEHNFDTLPEVHALDEFFHRKYEDVGEGDAHDLRQVATAEEILAEQEAHADHHIHMPSPSYWPIARRLAAADHRLRRHLQPADRRSSARRSWCSPCSAGRSSRRSPTTPTTTRRPTTSRARAGARERRASTGAAPAACRRRPIVATRLVTVDEIPSAPSRRAVDRPRRHALADMPEQRRARGARLDHRPVQQQDGDVAVPRLGVPAVRRPDPHVHAVPRPPLRQPRARPDLRHPVHVGVELRAADVVADDGARRVGGRTAATMRNTKLWLVDHGAARRHVRRRPGLRVHDVLPRGSRLHDEPVLVELLHADRVPRRPRDRRHHHAAVADA